jgi:signal peptidase I
MMIVITFAVGLALAIIAWVGIDTARRKRNWLAWSAATAFFGFFGLLAWLIHRRRAQVPPEPIEFRQALLIAMTAPILFAVSAAVMTSWTTFVFQVARVEGKAMAPTLNDQDRLIVNKMVFHRREEPFIPPEFRSHDNWGPQVIPEGYYFVLGDHRNNSSDSRHWSFVPKKYIVGRVQLRWWPISQARAF